MEHKSRLGENALPAAFATAILLLGTTAIYWQGYFNPSDAMNPMAFKDMRIKVVFDGPDPELLASVPPGRLRELKTIAGDPVPQADGMVLGYEESRDMAEELNITLEEALWGYDIPDFMGQKIRVTGMLKRTGTLVDMMHILPEERYDGYGPGQEITVRLSDERMPKFFYPLKSDGSNLPKTISFAQGGLDGFRFESEEETLSSINVGNINIPITQAKTYVPVIVGSAEAEMMLGEGLIAGAGDTIDGFFGKDVKIAGILAPTNTSLDMFHYVPEGYE
jgi:hypothetical protein